MAELLVAGLRRVNLQGSITLMDADIVEASNLGHQRYAPADIGRAKVTCIAERLDDETSRCAPTVVQNLRREAQFNDYDLAVVCVDRPNPSTCSRIEGSVA